MNDITIMQRFQNPQQCNGVEKDDAFLHFLLIGFVIVHHVLWQKFNHICLIRSKQAFTAIVLHQSLNEMVQTDCSSYGRYFPELFPLL